MTFFFPCFLPQDDPHLDGLSNDITFTPPDPDWFSDIEKEPHLVMPSPGSFNICYGSIQFSDGDTTKFADSLIVDPDEPHSEGLTSQRSSVIENWNLNHGFCLEAEDRADYGTVTDFLQNKNPIRESNKDSMVNPNANSKLSSTWNEPVGTNQRGSFGSPGTASARHEPSSSTGLLVYLLLIMVLIAVMVLGINERFKSLCHEVISSHFEIPPRYTLFIYFIFFKSRALSCVLKNTKNFYFLIVENF